MENSPQIMYGTAWKEDATEELVTQAINIGFRAIDTANQRKHYFEEAVGKAIAKVIKNGVPREDLFIQTKFTYTSGQDHRLPYNASDNHKTQVRQSFLSSLKHLQIDYIDSYVLHGPSDSAGISEEDWEVWREMETLHSEGKTKCLGVSNMHIEQLKTLFEGAKVKPTYVQNRCFAQQGWDKTIREFCKENNMIYQGFSLLTANPFVIPHVKKIADKYNKTSAQIIFKFSSQIGMLPLTGTTNKTHMKEALDLDFTLDEEEVLFIENIAFSLSRT